MAAQPKFQSLGTRWAILACFWFALLLSIPSWLRLTTIQRLPLPTKQIEALQLSETCPVTFNSSLTVLIDSELLPQGAEASLDAEVSFLQQVAQLVQQSLGIKAEMPTAASLECTRWTVHVQPTTEAGGNDVLYPEKARYVVRVLGESSTAAHHKVQRASLPTVYLPLIEDPDSLPLVPDTVSAAVIAELLHLRGDKVTTNDAPNRAVADTEQDPRVIQYSKHIRLVFSIMNQDVTDTTAYDSYLIHALASDNSTEQDSPIARLRRELDGLHDFHVETQVQWFAPLHFQPTQEVLEEVVEREVEEVVMVDEEVEEEVEVELQGEEEEEADSGISSEADDTHGVRAAKMATNDDIQALNEDETEVEAQLDTQPRTPSAARSPAKGRTRVVKQKRTIQVPRVKRSVKQTRTPLPPRHVIEWDDLKVFVNSEEWALTSTVPPASSHSSSLLERPFDVLSQTHDLHFLVYIPSRSHWPLLIRDPTTGGVREGANAWLIPQWGGVVVINAEHDERSNRRANSAGVIALPQYHDMPGGMAAKQLAPEAVEEAIGLFARQLEILLGLSTPSRDHIDPQDGMQRRVRIAILKQRRILELARETTNTLQAITRLVHRIENLGVGPEVKSDTEAALTILTSLPSLHPTEEAQDETIDELLKRVEQAYELSNRAFFNPDMLGLLYFPDEHKYAVYTPLFAPLLVPLFVTTLKLLKELRVALAKGRRAGPKGKGRKSK